MLKPLSCNSHVGWAELAKPNKLKCVGHYVGLRKLSPTYIILCLSLLSLPAYADGTGTTQVTDPSLESTTNNIYNVLNGQIYPALNNMVNAAQTSNQTMQESLTGTSGVGVEFNSPVEQNFRNWTPTAEDLANMVQQGLQTGSMADQMKYYNEKFPIPKVSDLTPGKENSLQGNYGVFSAVSTNTAFSVADKGFNNVAQIQAQINFLFNQIDRQQTLKQGIDLNSAILLKIAALQADLIRIQAQTLKMQAVHQQQGNTNRDFMTQFVQEIK